MSSPDNERRLFESKRAHFKGSAKVPLDLLQSYASSSFTFDEKNVARLIQVFELEGCYRLNPDHHVPATISLQIFEQALRDAGIDQHTLLTNDDPPLIRPEGVTVLHGRHRLHAAQTHLYPNEQWWVVDFYDDGLPQEVFTAIQEEYANSRHFCDGDIYRSLRHHQLNGNQTEAGKWLARLSDPKQDDIRQLHDRYGDLAKAFDSLLPVIGLWATLELGTFHRILTCRCVEEMIHYLQHINRIWRRILPAQYLSFVDPATVTFLETLAPKFSRRDRADITEAMHDRRIFPQINEEPMRARILDWILDIESRIPSLFSFLEDTKYLEPVSKVMRVPFPTIKPRSTTSIRDLFSRHFSRNNTSEIFIQQSELAYVSRNLAAVKREWAAYRQMWLFGWRHFPHLTDTLPRKDAGKPKPTHDRKRAPRLRFELADLASRSGYRSHEICLLLQEDPDRVMARSFLNQIRPDDIYDFSEEDRASIIEQICEEVNRRSSVVHSHVVPSFTTNERGQPKSHRCGRPFEQDHSIDQSFLFLENIYGNVAMQVKEHLTPFAIKRDIFLAFFGHDTHGIFGSQHPEDCPPNFPCHLLPAPPPPPAPTPTPTPAAAPSFLSQQPAPQLEAPSSSQQSTHPLETSPLETFQLEAPQLEAPQLEAPQLEAPRLEAPRLEAPQLEVPSPSQQPIIFPLQQRALRSELPSTSPRPASWSQHINPIIPGFTNNLEAEQVFTPNTANKLTSSRKVSEIIRSYLAQTDFIYANHIILCFWRRQEYIYYDLSLGNSKSLFNDMVRQLANEHYFFTVIDTPDKVFYSSPKEVWQRAQKFGIVLTDQKLSGGKHPYTGRNLDKFLSYIDQ